MSQAQRAAKWTPADQEHASECEKAFQNGGPRVYAQEEGVLRPSGLSATSTVRMACPGATVCARRKTGNQYLWFAHPAA